MADHIVAADNTTRKLISNGQRPLSVGFFSLGHSIVVFLLALLFALGIRSLSGPVQEDGSALHQTLGFGTSVSGVFLYVIAAFIVVSLVTILKVFRKMRTGGHDETDLEAQLNSGGGQLQPAGREPHRTPFQDA